MKTRTTVLLGAVCTGLALSLSATAVQRIYVTNASGVCQGALPAYETAIRKRPTAIANEGAGPAFVSCSFSGDNGNSSGPPGYVAVFVSNRSASTRTVNCTLVDGTNIIGETTPTIIAKSADVPANTAAVFVWDPVADNGGVDFSQTNNLSCQLQPGVELNLMGYPFEDGSAPAAPAP